MSKQLDRDALGEETLGGGGQGAALELPCPVSVDWTGEFKTHLRRATSSGGSTGSLLTAGIEPGPLRLDPGRDPEPGKRSLDHRLRATPASAAPGWL